MMQQGGGAVPATDSSAITSMVLGIAGLVVIPVILSIPAVIIGKQSEKKIAASGGTLKGAEFAKVGIVCGWIGIALGIVLIVVGLIAIMGLVSSSNV